MTQSSYDSWLWFQLNPEERPQRHRNHQKIKEPDGWVDPIQAAENMAIITMTEQDRERADKAHLEKHGFYF